jgi:hypothetical protein
MTGDGQKADLQSRHDRLTYAMHRLAQAIDRGIMATDDQKRARAQRWAQAWHASAYARLDVLSRMNSFKGLNDGQGRP